MKKVKIMLLSLSLVAVVGGALAFKAKYSQPICYTNDFLPGGKTSCPLFIATSQKVNIANKPTSYTTDAVGGTCFDVNDDALRCGPTTSLIPN